jgi:hypothetical protein
MKPLLSLSLFTFLAFYSVLLCDQNTRISEEDRLSEYRLLIDDLGIKVSLLFAR